MEVVKILMSPPVRSSMLVKLKDGFEPLFPMDIVKFWAQLLVILKFLTFSVICFFLRFKHWIFFTFLSLQSIPVLFYHSSTAAIQTSVRKCSRYETENKDSGGWEGIGIRVGVLPKPNDLRCNLYVIMYFITIVQKPVTRVKNMQHAVNNNNAGLLKNSLAYWHACFIQLICYLRQYWCLLLWQTRFP